MSSTRLIFNLMSYRRHNLNVIKSITYNSKFAMWKTIFHFEKKDAALQFEFLCNEIVFPHCDKQYIGPPPSGMIRYFNIFSRQATAVVPAPNSVQTTPTRLTAYLFLTLSMSLVGSYVALSKPLVVALPVLLLAWMRFGIGGLAMPHWLKKPVGEPPMTLETKKLVFLESFLGNFLFTICMLYGVSMTSAVSAGVIMASIPAAIALMSWFFLRERIGLRVWAAIACAAFGIGLFALSKSELHAQSGRGLEVNLAQKNVLLGNLLVFGAVLCEAAYAVIGKKLTGALTPKRITALINLWGFVLMTPMGIYMALKFDFGAVTSTTWLLLVFYALAASVWTVWLWMTALKTVPAAKAGVFTVMLPISAALVGVLALGETLRGVQLLAFAICLLGVVLATLPARARASVTSASLK